MHSNGVAHNDIKLENIVYDSYTKKIKLVDFGFACFAKPNDMIRTRYISTSYASPEILSGNEFSPMKADIWALGVVYYTILFLQQPFFDETKEGEMQKIIKCDYVIPSTASNYERNFILTTMKANPQKRITAEEALSFFP